MTTVNDATALMKRKYPRRPITAEDVLALRRYLWLYYGHCPDLAELLHNLGA